MTSINWDCKWQARWGRAEALEVLDPCVCFTPCSLPLPSPLAWRSLPVLVRHSKARCIRLLCPCAAGAWRGVAGPVEQLIKIERALQ